MGFGGREGREVDGRGASMGRRPPVECNEGENEWFAGGISRNGARVSSFYSQAPWQQQHGTAYDPGGVPVSLSRASFA